ncbi:ferritin-like fold-containing protein [Micromonospora chalcea]|uniref:ferritin-like fold-containing protein n=1 Tax=Micromonospora TaxID=1873 RepID=UPI0023784D00|nr:MULTISPECIES: ferritin-like fold-containing protein [Micromonospora]WBB85300.1 ferritin-like fold-containing protein [Micromonospora sp. WMMC264]WDP97819.1 ferritin-like fold-containing protein [Micromonospora chalcea]
MAAPDPAATGSAAAGPTAPDPAAIDLFGLVAYGELLAFDRLAADARLAPDLGRRAALSEMAAAEIAHYRWLTDRLAAWGVTPEEAMVPYVEALRAYHDSTEPRDWAEAVTKAYVGDAITDDFLRGIAGGLDGPERTLLLDVLHDSRYAEFAAAEIRAAIEADPRAAGRLSMWARRLLGEALSQAGRVAAADRGALSALIGRTGGDVPGLLRRLTEAHTARMTAVGLNN